jgi:ABC-type transport system involved in multi-copper enzyme maturation permease subunit
VTLTAIPLLTFFTLEPLAHLTARYDWREQPHQQVSEFKAKAVSAGVGLIQGLGTKLTRIVSEEQDRVDPPSSFDNPDKTKRFTDSALSQQIEQARSCHERIRQRVRPLLNERQFQVFEQWQREKLDQAIETIKKFNLQNLRPFYRWLVDFYFLLVLPLYGLSVCGSMIRDELQSDTLGFLTTRLVGRARLFLIKYLCQMTWLQAMAAGHGLLLFGVGFARSVPGVASMIGLFFGAQVLAVLAWGALSALLGLITRRYMVLGIVYGFVVEMGIGRIPTNINTLSLTRHLQALLGHNALLNELYEWAPQSAWFSVGMVLLATGVFLGAGAALFTFREYHHATEMQK